MRAHRTVSRLCLFVATLLATPLSAIAFDCPGPRRDKAAAWLEQQLAGGMMLVEGKIVGAAVVARVPDSDFLEVLISLEPRRIAGAERPKDHLDGDSRLHILHTTWIDGDARSYFLGPHSVAHWKFDHVWFVSAKTKPYEAFGETFKVVLGDSCTSMQIGGMDRALIDALPWRTVP